MKPEHTFYIVMYDITHSKALQKTNKLLRQAGLERVNYSVWIGWQNPANIPALKESLKELLKPKQAKGSVFYILPVSKKNLEKMRNINGRKPKELDYWMGERLTMFF